MAIDRSKFKTSSSIAMKQQYDEIDATIKNREVFADKLEITNGVNKFRIFPYHPDGGGDVYAETKVVHWLPAMMPEKDNGKVVLDSKGKPRGNAATGSLQSG